MRRLFTWVADHPIVSSFVLALAVRVAVALMVLALSGGTLFYDDSTYSALAEAVVEGQTGVWGPYEHFLYNSTAAFTLPLTIGYYVFGVHPVTGQLIAAVGGAAAAAATAVLALRVVERRWALAAGAIVALLPSQVLFSSLTLKDSLVWASLAGLSVAMALANGSMGKGRLLVGGLGVVGALTVLAHLRPHSLVMASWAVGIAAWAGVSRQRGLRGVVGVAIAVFLPWAFGVGLAGLSVTRSASGLENIRVANAVGAATSFVRPPVEDSTVDLSAAQARAAEVKGELAVVQAEASELAKALADASADDIEAAAPHVRSLRVRIAALEREASAAAARSAELALEVELATVGTDEGNQWVRSNLAHLPKGVSVMLIEPFLWDIDGNSRVAFAAAELVLWYPLLVLACIGAIRSLRRHHGALLLPALLGAGVALMYGLAEGNFGSAYRHRGELSWAVVLFAALGLRHLWDARVRTRV